MKFFHVSFFCKVRQNFIKLFSKVSRPLNVSSNNTNYTSLMSITVNDSHELVDVSKLSSVSAGGTLNSVGKECPTHA